MSTTPGTEENAVAFENGGSARVLPDTETPDSFWVQLYDSGDVVGVRVSRSEARELASLIMRSTRTVTS